MRATKDRLTVTLFPEKASRHSMHVALLQKSEDYFMSRNCKRVLILKEC